MLKDFKAFLMRGNVLDLAVAVVIGAAFGAIVKSLVDDILMPPLGLIVGKLDFSNLFFVLQDGTKAPPPYTTVAAAKDAGAVTLNYGAFINNIIAFLIVAAAVFMVVRMANRCTPSPRRPRRTPSRAPSARCRFRSPRRAARTARRNSDPASTAKPRRFRRRYGTIGRTVSVITGILPSIVLLNSARSTSTSFLYADFASSRSFSMSPSHASADSVGA